MYSLKLVTWNDFLLKFCAVASGWLTELALLGRVWVTLFTTRDWLTLVCWGADWPPPES